MRLCHLRRPKTHHPNKLIGLQVSLLWGSKIFSSASFGAPRLDLQRSPTPASSDSMRARVLPQAAGQRRSKPPTEAGDAATEQLIACTCLHRFVLIQISREKNPTMKAVRLQVGSDIVIQVAFSFPCKK